jgi:hypothetical protein
VPSLAANDPIAAKMLLAAHDLCSDLLDENPSPYDGDDNEYLRGMIELLGDVIGRGDGFDPGGDEWRVHMVDRIRRSRTAYVVELLGHDGTVIERQKFRTMNSAEEAVRLLGRELTCIRAGDDERIFESGSLRWYAA